MKPIDATALLDQMRALAAQAGGSEPAEKPSREADFAAILGQSIARVNSLQKEAGRLAEAFERGDPEVSLVEVQVALQKATISFQALTQVRNKLVSAYQEIMNMPM